MTKRDPFKYFHSSPEIIRLAVMMYVRFPLSLRNVEDLLHERGIDISHETVRYWWNRFGPMFAAEIRRNRVSRMRAYSNWQWHLDEVFVKINGEPHYLWRAVDHEGEVLESFVTKTRDRKAALKLIKKSMKRHGHPRIYTGDRQTSILRRGDEGYRQYRQAENWPLDEQSGGEFALAVPTTRTGYATVSQHAKFAKIRRRSCFGLQPFQSGAPPLLTRKFQAEPNRCSR